MLGQVGKCKEIDVPLRQDVVYNDRVVRALHRPL